MEAYYTKGTHVTSQHIIRKYARVSAQDHLLSYYFNVIETECIRSQST